MEFSKYALVRLYYKTYEFLLEVQRKWLEEKFPSNICGLEGLLESIFDLYEKHKDT